MIKLGNNFKETIAIKNINLITDDIFNHISDLKSQLDYQDINESETFLYQNVFGGNFYLIENEEDLKEIKTTKENKGERLSLFDTADLFDVFEMLPGTERTIICILITNNAGGNVYFIPRKIKHKNIEASLVLQNNKLRK